MQNLIVANEHDYFLSKHIFSFKINKTVFNTKQIIYSTTQGLEDVSHYPQLIISLMKNHSWTETQIKKLAGENLMRVFSKVEKVKMYE